MSILPAYQRSAFDPLIERAESWASVHLIVGLIFTPVQGDSSGISEIPSQNQRHPTLGIVPCCCNFGQAALSLQVSLCFVPDLRKSLLEIGPLQLESYLVG